MNQIFIFVVPSGATQRDFEAAVRDFIASQRARRKPEGEAELEVSIEPELRSRAIVFKGTRP